MALVAAEDARAGQRRPPRSSRSTTSRCPSSSTWRQAPAARRAPAARARERAPARPHRARRSGAAEADVWVEGYYETAMQDAGRARARGRPRAVPARDGGVDLYVDIAVAPRRPRAGRARASTSPRSRCGSRSPASAARSGRARTSACRSTPACCALRTGRPVKMAYGREESFHGHVHRHPSRTWIRYGGDARRPARAADVRLLLDGGAYASSSPAVLANASTFAAGPYEVPNVRIEGTVVYTNNPPCGAMRGFGAAAGVLRPRVGARRARGRARDRPGRAAPAQRRPHGIGAADRPGADRAARPSAS